MCVCVIRDSWDLDELELFFQQPRCLFALERELFRKRYHNLILGGLVYALLNDDLEMAELVMGHVVPLELQNQLRVSDLQWKYVEDPLMKLHPFGKQDVV